MATTSRDKKIRVWDVRQERAVSEHAGHAGAKNSRAVWMGEHNRIATTGFSRMSERQIALWEPGNSEPIGGFTMLDSISGVCMPFWGGFFFLFPPPSPFPTYPYSLEPCFWVGADYGRIRDVTEMLM